MINKLSPFKGLNIKIPIIIPIKGRGFINQGSGLPPEIMLSSNLGWPLGYLNIFPYRFHKDPKGQPSNEGKFILWGIMLSSNEGKFILWGIESVDRYLGGCQNYGPCVGYPKY